jgi:hypothetical protein
MKIFFLILIIHLKTLLCSLWLNSLPPQHVEHLKACSFCWTQLNNKVRIWERAYNINVIPLYAQLSSREIELKIIKEGSEKQSLELLKLHKRVEELSNNLLSKNAIIESQDSKINEMNYVISNLQKEVQMMIEYIKRNVYLKNRLFPKVENMGKIILELVQKGSKKIEPIENEKGIKEITQDPSVNLETDDVRECELLERDQKMQFSKPRSVNADEFENYIQKSQTILPNFENIPNFINITNQQKTELNEMKETIKSLALEFYEILENSKRKAKDLEERIRKIELLGQDLNLNIKEELKKELGEFPLIDDWIQSQDFYINHLGQTSKNFKIFKNNPEIDPLPRREKLLDKAVVKTEYWT